MSLDTIANELVGDYPGLSLLVARNQVQKAWHDICDETMWSWLSAEAPLYVPSQISLGAVTVTLGSAAVVGDATAAAAWLPVALANPPLASPALGQGRQFRLGLGNPVYNIVAFDGVNTLTLDRLYGEPSGAGQPYQIYRSYYAAPSPDFLRYFAITNYQSAYSIVAKWLTFNQEQLNRMDPQRGAQGDAYILSSYKVAADGSPVHELWPTPTNPNSYIAIYQRRGLDLTPTGTIPFVDLPATLNKSVLKSRSDYQTALWAAKNVNRYRDLAGINWLSIRKEAKAHYDKELVTAQRIDFEIFKNTYIIPKGLYTGFPVDARFIQSHDVEGMYGDLG